jgi:hypothetical protein
MGVVGVGWGVAVLAVCLGEALIELLRSLDHVGVESGDWSGLPPEVARGFGE